jgi:hypothetical protein
MRGDPRIQSARPLQSRAHVSTILPPMDLGVYLYDGAGNIESIGNDQFRYDEAGRLKSATVNGSANQQTFGYDAFGNRKDAARAASASVCIGNTNCEMSAPVEATNTNHLTAATYDDAGNVTVLDGTYSYSYDALNMVKSTGGREYVYTADDERIATVSGGGWTWTIRSPSQQVLSEFTSSGTNGAVELEVDAGSHLAGRVTAGSGGEERLGRHRDPPLPPRPSRNAAPDHERHGPADRPSCVLSVRNGVAVINDRGTAGQHQVHGPRMGRSRRRHSRSDVTCMRGITARRWGDSYPSIQCSL